MLTGRTRKAWAPKNVVISRWRFGLLGAGQKGRLEASEHRAAALAWIATNGKVIRGTWKKPSATQRHPVLRQRRQAGHAHPRPDLRPGDPARDSPFKLVKGKPVSDLDAPTPDGNAGVPSPDSLKSLSPPPPPA